LAAKCGGRGDIGSSAISTALRFVEQLPNNAPSAVAPNPAALSQRKCLREMFFSSSPDMVIPL
jgi:hypothetical protein